MKQPTNHPESSAHQIPKGAEVGKTLSYILRSNQETIKVLRALVQSKIEDILDLIVEDIEMRAIVFAYTAHEKLTRAQADRMRRFLWGKFAGGLDPSESVEHHGDSGEYGNEKLKVFGEKIRHAYVDNWWLGDMSDIAETIVSLVKEILSHYATHDIGDDLDTTKDGVNTAVKIKKDDPHTFKKTPYGGHASVSMEREDALSIDTILTMMSSYFDTMDMKVNGKMTTANPLTRERESGRWKSIQKIMQEMKRLMSYTAILDALEENTGALSAESVKTVTQRFDSYAILHGEGEL